MPHPLNRIVETTIREPIVQESGSERSHGSQGLPQPAVWFPAVRAGTGADVFTQRLAAALERFGVRSEITWLPPRAEYAPWTTAVPRPPPWANLVHINSWLHSRFLPKGLPILATLHSCVHDVALEPYKTRPQKLYHHYWIRTTEQRTLLIADVVTAVSHYTAGRAIEIFGRPDIHPIHNWLDMESFAPDARTAPNKTFRLLFVGSLNHRKGADLIPFIMRELGEAFELLYTGAEAEMRRFGARTPNMIALGRISDIETLAETYRSCDALLFPTRLEGFGLVALEALACGRPVIATDCTSLPEIIGAGEGGILCPANDVAAFCQAARQMKDNPESWRQRCAAARIRAEAFSEEKAVARYLELYGQLLSRATSQ